MVINALINHMRCGYESKKVGRAKNDKRKDSEQISPRLNAQTFRSEMKQSTKMVPHQRNLICHMVNIT